jgi:uncharacterized protein (TIGR02391 family)
MDMAGLIDYLPDADSLIALGPEDLGLILLQLAQKQPPGGNFALSNLEMPLWNANSPAYPPHKRMPVARAIAEASQWLQNEGLSMAAPDQPIGYFCVTRKGAQLKSAADIDAYRQGSVLPVGLLHPQLAEKVRPMFLRGDYDVAVFQAFKEVEVAVRKAAGLPNDLVGVNLMRRAFHPETGALSDSQSIPAEREALMHLYSGAIGHCKNPPSHREVKIERVSAAQLIGFASHLLMLVETIVALRTSGSVAATGVR